MSEIVADVSEIPLAWGYVVCTDTAMSGWGPAEGKINVCIFPVASSRDADIVKQNCEWRSEMEDVRIRRQIIFLRGHILYSLFSQEDAPRFYQIDGFHPANREER